MTDMNFTPYQKMSKADRKKMDMLKRAVWDFKPTTRIKQSAKLYKRERISTRDWQ